MNAKVKVHVWRDLYDGVAFAETRDPANANFAKKGLVRIGTVEIERVGVVWGTVDEVSRTVRERVQAEIDAGRMVPA